MPPPSKKAKTETTPPTPWLKEKNGLGAIRTYLDRIPVVCGGTLDLEDYKKIGGGWLVARKDEQDGTIVSHLPISPLSAKILYDSATPSSFGSGKITVYDESVRLAREYSSSKFTLAFDPLHHNHASNDILLAIETFTSKSPASLYAVCSKMAIYGQGGFFQKHKDTPKGEDHLGTIVVCLPSAFQGGEFLLYNDRNGKENMQKLEAWSKVASSSENPKLSWVFFYSDTSHEIDKVTSGYRVTVQYDVFQRSNLSQNAQHGGNVTMSKNQMIDDEGFKMLKKAMRDTIFDKEFFSDGGKLTWAFDHSYPRSTKIDLDDKPRKSWAKAYQTQNAAFRSQLAHKLKGTDHVFHQALQDLGFDVSLLAVYKDSKPDDNSNCTGMKFWKDTSLVTSPYWTLIFEDRLSAADVRFKNMISMASFCFRYDN